MPRRIALAAACGLLVTACTLGPDYKRLPVQTPEQWRQAAADQASLADVPWWQLFQDEALQNLIERALQENRDLKVAVERIEEARARYGISRSYLFPDIGLDAQAGRLRTSEGSLVHTPENVVGRNNPTDLYTLGLGLNWELDFFGRIRRASEADMAIMLATEEARRAVTVTLVADVARAYVELRELDSRLEISQRTLETRREYMGLARDRFEGGVTPEVDFRQAEAELYRIEALVAESEKLIAQKEDEISVLVGANPGAIPRGRALFQQPIPPQVPAGLPSALLERRPDIRVAEEQLVSANARIGEAKALLFPTISLTGSFGQASTDLDNLLDSPSRSWNVIAGLFQPIFQAGRNRRRVEVTESLQRQAAYGYEQTVLQALREVEDSLVALQKNGEQRTAQGLRVGAERKVVELSELRYRGGVAAYLEVLDSQRSLFDAELDEVATARMQFVSLIQLYRALGGGWPAENAAGAPGGLSPAGNAPRPAASPQPTPSG